MKSPEMLAFLTLAEKAAADRIDKHGNLVLSSDDLVKLSKWLERLQAVGTVGQRNGWPVGDLNDVGRVLPKGSVLYSVVAFESQLVTRRARRRVE